jgi:hypothetical protein
MEDRVRRSTVVACVISFILVVAVSFPALSQEPPTVRVGPRAHRLAVLEEATHTQVTEAPPAPFDLEAAKAAYEAVYWQIADAHTASEFDAIEVKTEEPGSVRAAYPEIGHTSLTEAAAAYWGLSATRKATMKSAADRPDTYQSGISNYYNQQWSHAFLMASGGIWLWGDADDDFHDNLDGDGGELESPEGYNGYSAKDYYQSGNQYWGDWYVGYAIHYIEDVCIVVHATAPSPSRLDVLTKHFAFEDWIKVNLTAGHKLLAAATADTYYYPITDPKASINTAAYNTSYWAGGTGKRVWDAYVASGYPTTAGSGNATLVAGAKEMMVRAIRYTRGTIKYSLDTYGQWTATY